jgi:signal transduction histidine kinase/CheY-like chemotaxis protein
LSGSDLENERLAALRALDLLDTAPEPEFDSLTDLAAAVLGVQMAAVSLVDRDRQWFKSALNLPVRETPRDIAICHHTIQQDGILHVPDTLEDPRFRDNPLVTGGPRLRGYAGVPLQDPTGYRVGTLCVLHNQPLPLDDDKRSRLAALGRLVEERIAERVRDRDSRSANRVLAAITAIQRDFIEANGQEEIAMPGLLAAAIELTGSEMGVVGDLHTSGGVVTLNVRAALDHEGRQKQRRSIELLPFRDDLRDALERGRPAVIVETERLQRFQDLAGGQTPDSVAVIPLFSRDRQIALLGLANRPGGYSEAELEGWRPFFQSAGQLMGALLTSRARDQALLRLAESEQRYNLALEGVASGVWEMNPGTGALFTSDRLLDIIGNARSQDGQRGIDEPDGYARFLERVHPEDRPVLEQALKQSWDSGGTLECSYRYRHARGHDIELFVRGKTQLDRHGRPHRMVGSAEDVTAQRQLAREEERYRQRLEALSELGGIGSWEVDLVENRVYWDAITRRIHEVDADFEPDVETGINFYAPEARGPITQAIERAIASGETWDLELPLITAKDRRIWVRAVGKPILRDGQAVKLLGSFQDITERRERQYAMRTLESRLAMSLEASEIGSWEYCRATGQHSWDENTRKLYAYPLDADMPPGHEFVERLHPDDRARVITGIQKIFDTGGRLTEEFRFLDWNGNWKHIRSYGLFVERPEGPGILTGFNYDVTADVELARELGEARARAEAASQAKSQFLANMSHEIRTPLNGMMGMAQLLQLSDLNPEQADSVQTLKSCGQALLDIVEDVLDIAKIESGLFEIASAPFDLTALLQSTLKIAGATARDKGLSLTLDIGPDVPSRVVGDEKRIRQVLINMLGNAAKFTREGAVGLTVHRLESGDLRFEVRDTGPGIAEAHLAKVFDRFVQADVSSTRSHGGTGLGLAICREIVERAGGRIGVDSRLGEGSLFWFELPWLEAEADETRAASVSSIVGLDAGSRGRVLVVDDVETNRIVAAALVGRAGFQVELAASGAEALKRLEQDRFDAVLMDIQMPEMSGEEAIRRIRQSGRDYAGLPIIAVTADATAGARERYLSIGASDYLTKPLDLGHVNAVLGALRSAA